MNWRLQVKEPPRHGHPGRARFHLRDSFELVGWTNNQEEAKEWLEGFGPVTTAHVEDRGKAAALPRER